MRFRDLRFGYAPDEPPVMDRLVFELRAGQVLGVLGRTDSGKTTLTRLLCL